MDRVERTGLGLSVAGHVIVFAALSLGLFAASKPVVPQVQPIDIQIVDKVGLTDTVPNPSTTPPAARVSPEVGEPEEAASEAQPEPTPEPDVAPPEPVAKPAPPKPAPPKPAPPKPAPPKPTPPKPVAKPVAKPTPPKPVAKPVAAKPAPAKPAPQKPAPAAPAKASSATKTSQATKSGKAAPSKATTSTSDARPRRPGLDRSLVAGLTDAPGVSSPKANSSTSTAPRAAAGPAVEASLAREVLRQLKPFWHSPTGADAELLRTQLSISLSKDGRVVAVRAIGTTGVTDSNRGQVRLHQEAAIKAVRLAAPFSLPAEFFETWKLLEPVSFDRKLSQ